MTKNWIDRFDEKFGKKGPDGNSDSIGRKAGCDDCSENIELREEYKSFIAQEIAEAEKRVIEECAVIAWSTGMQLYKKQDDEREVGSEIASRIRLLKTTNQNEK